MNNEIKMNEGFIYSDYFYNLKDKGLTPDEGLLKYVSIKESSKAGGKYK